MAYNQSVSSKKDYINCDIRRSTTAIFENQVGDQGFDVWFAGLDAEKKQKIEKRFDYLNQALTEKLYQKELISRSEQERISTHIAKVAFRIISETGNMESNHDTQVFNGLKRSAQEVLEIYNEFVGLNWIQMAFANNYDFESLIEEIRLKYNKKEDQIEALSQAENFLPQLVNFGLYAGDQSEKLSKEQIHKILTELFGKKVVDKAFVDAKKIDDKNKNQILTQMIKLVISNHSKILAWNALLILFESATAAFATNNLIVNVPKLEFDAIFVNAAIYVATMVSNQLVNFNSNKMDIFMENGSKDLDTNFHGLEAMLIDIIANDPHFAQIHTQINPNENPKRYIEEIKQEYLDLYNLIFNGVLKSIVTIVGSMVAATTLIKSSPATIIPPLVIVCINYGIQELQNNLIFSKEKDRMVLSAKIQNTLQSLVMEMSNKLQIRDPESVYAQIYPKLVDLKNQILAIKSAASTIQSIDNSVPVYVLMSTLARKSGNQVLQALFGSDPNSVFSLAMVQGNIGRSITSFTDYIQKIKLTLEIINSSFLARLNKQSLNQEQILDSTINFENFILFRNRPENIKNVQIKPGEIIIIQGPSGSGKSTLLTSITTQTFKNPYQGEIKIGSTPLYLIKPEIYQQMIAAMPQEVQVFTATVGVNICGEEKLDPEIFDLFVKSPLAKNLYEKKLKQMNDDHKVDTQIDWWKDNIENYKISDLSGGEKKMLGILRVKARLLKNPGKIFFVVLDESLTNLSVKNGSTPETQDESMLEWVQDITLNLMKDYPSITFIFIDHSSDENSLQNQILGDTKLSSRFQIFEI